MSVHTITKNTQGTSNAAGTLVFARKSRYKYVGISVKDDCIHFSLVTLE